MKRNNNMTGRILRSGLNCRTVASSTRLAFLVDGCDYFAALANSLEKAARRIFIVGWDFDSELKLTPQHAALGDMLRDLVERSPDLEVYILIWRNSVFYGSSSELPNYLTKDWWKHERIHYRLDDAHPVGSSHHQKIVTIDDRLAFVGGIDVTRHRWDERTHCADMPYRVADGEPYAPVHDLQSVFDGEAASAVVQVTRERWETACAELLEPVAVDSDPWPDGIEPVIRNATIGIARTLPTYGERPEVRECEALIAHAIAAAEKILYIETQYFALVGAADMLAAHLRRPDGPEIVLLVTRRSQGVLEQYAMADQRDRLFAQLRKADLYDRLGVFFPVAKKEPECEIVIHSKLTIVDDRFVRLGSANMNNRSMGVDTECDIAVEAATAETEQAIRDLRHDLLAEHLCVAPEKVAETVQRLGSVLAAIEELNCGERCLIPYRVDLSLDAASEAAGLELIDPPEPINLTYVWNVLTKRMMPDLGGGSAEAEKSKIP